MSEASKSQSEKNHELDSFVCPHCRLLFSIRRHFDGNGAVCPGCEKLLSIPSFHDGVEAQGLSKVRFAQAGIMRKEINEARLLKAGRWRENQKEARKLEGEDKATRWMLPIGIVAILMLGGIVFVLLSGNDDKPKPRTVAIPEPDDDSQELTVSAESKFGHIAAKNRDLLEKQLKAYYLADTVEERMKYCRPAKKLKEKMEKYYARSKAPKLKVRRLLKSGDLPRESSYYYYSAEMEDYSIKDGIFVYQNGEVLLDWESQVAYSEMSWDELKKKKPTTPVMMRFKTVPLRYYNDYFIDDKKWYSMRLYNEVNEKDKTLFGYAKVGSAVVEKISNFGMNKGAMFVTLLVKYPEGATNPDQVIITDVLAKSWVYNPDSEKSDEK